MAEKCCYNVISLQKLEEAKMKTREDKGMVKLYKKIQHYSF